MFYNFSKTQLSQLKKFTCENSKFEYIEQMEYDQFTLKQYYFIVTAYTASCRMMPWANKWVRFTYSMAVGPLKDQFDGKKFKILDIDDVNPLLPESRG